MPWDFGIGFKLFDYAVKYRKHIRRGWDFLFRTEPIRLKLEPPPLRQPKVYRCHYSNITLVIALDRSKVLFLNTGNAGWNDREVIFDVDVESPDIDAVLHSLERADRVIVARWYKVALCDEITKKRNYMVSGRNRWEFALSVYVSDFSSVADTGANHAQRVLRARRLLFDEKDEELGVPENFSEKDILEYINGVAKEYH